jgi:hypothetical protein
MTYEWEEDVTAELMEEIELMLPDGLSLIGLAVANDELAEAALIISDSYESGGIKRMDELQDVSGDAQRHYEASVLADRGREDERVH